ncbi:MAG TPA: YkgJ family cysteine cluster protein [Chitinophagales bacterium]|nr:YkgJ family cysteine cluster protein [Chitinophagales bacterium]
MEQNLQRIDALGKLRKEENEHFRNLVRGKNAHKVDLLVQKLNKEIAPKIDCTACGNCCRGLSPYLNKGDIKRLGEGLNLSAEQVVKRYTETDSSGVSFKHMPCKFLKENKCTVYQHRPDVCMSFPHLHKDGFITRSRRVFDNYGLCPIVFNVIEKMKQEMKFKFHQPDEG